MAKRTIQADDLLKLAYVGDPQISPDGSRVLFGVKRVDEKNQYVSHLHVVDLSTGEVKQWTHGSTSCSAGRWSPDGSQIAFVSGRDKPGAQFYLLPTSGGEARKLSSLPEGSIGEHRWSPDGAKLAFTFRETHPSRTTQAAKQREEKGLSTPPWEIDDIWYRLDGDGYFGPQRHKLYLLDASSGKHKLLYEKSSSGFYAFDWTPDSKALVVAHSANEHPFFEPPNDQLHFVPLKGSAKKVKGLERGSIGKVRVSPDGSTIAYLGDLVLDDPWGVKNTRVFVVPMAGGPQVCLTEKDDYCFGTATLSDTSDVSSSGALEWTPDGKKLLVNISWHGESQAGLVCAEKGGVTALTSGPHVLGLGNLSRKGVIACAIGDPTHPMEVASLDLAKPEVVKRTEFNKALLEEVQLVAPESHYVESTDGVQVQVWCMKAVGLKKQGPAVLEIHGGPHCQYGWLFFHEFQLLAAHGYTVVFSNPRGSKGYGEAFCASIRGDWGNKDWEDIRAVKDWMKAQPYVDASRMGVMGGSYGGYMTNWVVGHTNDFKAAITDRCVSNLVSMAGNSDFPFNKDGYFGGYAYGDLDAIAPLWRQSPIAYFDKVQTPMLVIHSEGDLRCNVEQSEQVFAALKERKVPTRFVRYPASTSHGMSRSGPPDLRMHRLGEVLGWWKAHLK